MELLHSQCARDNGGKLRCARLASEVYAPCKFTVPHPLAVAWQSSDHCSVGQGYRWAFALTIYLNREKRSEIPLYSRKFLTSSLRPEVVR